MVDGTFEERCMAKQGLDKIFIRDLQIRCIVGLYPEERREKQDVIINIALWADYRAACESDRIEDTVDYKAVKKEILRVVESSEFFLVEALAQAIADVCLKADKVQQVRVTLDKPGALRFARSVAVEITRCRE
jgi:D-erythro-7,8-dihydroneopterin triphosphate epimerase